MGSPPTVIGALAVVFIFISSVFFLLILSPVPADVVSRRVVLSCIWLWLCDRSARSSAKSRSSSCVQSVHCIPLFLPVVVVFMIQSMTRRKRNGESRHPCRTPVFTSKLSDSWLAWQICSSCPGRCTGWGRLSSWGLHSVSVASTLSLCLHCQRPSHNLWSWCRGGSSTPVTVPRWCAGWRSGRHRICYARSLPAGHRAWGRQPPSSFPVESCWEPCLALTGAWSLDSCCSP